MGSLEINNLKQREGFAFISRVGRTICIEKRAIRDKDCFVDEKAEGVEVT